jgi:Ser/Thr protein kinase RdoA (MazF antagonist)
MENIVSITTHLRRKIIANGGNPSREALTLIPTKESGYLYQTGEGGFWRVYIYIENVRTFQVAQNLEHVFNAGLAYGIFLLLLDDFPAEELHETILDFHNTPVRYENFMAAVERDEFQRAAGAREEIDFLLRRSTEMDHLVKLIEVGDLPTRVTHNDTKFNNVLIDDQTGEGVCIIDLDTVMPGLSLYDYGDAIRSIANTGAEDEPDLSKVSFGLDLFTSFTRGYLRATRDTLTPLEIELLPFSARLITMECGMRFLTDYLEGDVYFRIAPTRPKHNLERSRTQFKLVREMEDLAEEMTAVVKACLF